MLKKVLFFIGLGSFIGYFITISILSINVNSRCLHSLKRASYSNTIPTAKKELKTALDYLEKNNLTSGYTSILWKSPDEDIEYWYNNIKSSYSELENVDSNITKLEECNILFKLNQTLVSKSRRGDIIAPNGISRYPNNTLFMLWGLPSFLLSLIFGVIWYFYWINDDEY